MLRKLLRFSNASAQHPVTTKIGNTSYTVFFGLKDYVMAPGHAYYNAETHTLQLPDGVQHQCYYYDHPGQEAFIIATLREELILSTTGVQAISIALPSAHETRNDLRDFKLSGIKRFNNPADGFDILFSWRGSQTKKMSPLTDREYFILKGFNEGTSPTKSISTETDYVLVEGPNESADPTKLIKKVFIKKLLNKPQDEPSEAIVSSSSRPVMQSMRFPIVNYNVMDLRTTVIDIAVWNNDFKSADHSELELKVNDLATNDHRFFGHLYADGTFRITEVSDKHPWLVNVRPFTGWVCHTGGKYLLVANYLLNKKIVSVHNTEILIDLPTDNNSVFDNPVTRAYTVEDQDPEDDTFKIDYARYTDTHSIGELIEANKFCSKNSKTITGCWLETMSRAKITIYPNIDLDTEINANATREIIVNKAQPFPATVNGHCYPLNKVLKLSIKVAAYGTKQYEATETQGTYYEHEDISALIAHVKHQYAEIIYVMMNNNTNPKLNLRMPVESGYQKIAFGDEAVEISYTSGTRSFKYSDLVVAQKNAFLNEHHVLTLELKPLIMLDEAYGHKKIILLVWKNLHHSNNLYDELLDEKLKKQYAQSLQLHTDEIDIANLYLENNSLVALNKKEGPIDDYNKVTANAWAFQLETERLFIIKGEYEYSIIYVDKNSEQHTSTWPYNDLFGVIKHHHRIESITLNKAQQNLLIRYENRHADTGEELSLTKPIDALINECKEASLKPQKPHMTKREFAEYKKKHAHRVK